MTETAPPTDSVEALVTSYLDHLNDVAYVRQIFETHSLPDVYRGLLAILHGGGRQQIINAGFFIRDVVNYGRHREFIARLSRSGIFTALEENIYASDYAVRSTAVYTIGKITFRRNARMLDRGFHVYLERDPLELPGLLGELFWLSPKARRRRWEYYAAIARSPHYITRWGSIGKKHWGVDSAKRSNCHSGDGE